MATWIKAPDSLDDCCDCQPNVCDDCCSPPVISSPGTANGTECSAFSYNITASNSPTSYSVTGTLPSGLSLNTGTGVISGTPSSGSTGTYNVTIGASNACGSDSLALAITIADFACPGSFTGTSSTVSTATSGSCIDDTFDVTGDFPCSVDVSVQWTATTDGTSFIVYANASSIYSSGCLTSNGSTSITIPAGTTSLRVTADCGCAVGPGSAFSVTIECP
jgi:hypothetical protein